MFNALILSTVVSILVLLVTRSVLFCPIRNKFRDIKFIGQLLSCPYCFSHWAAFLIILFTTPNFLNIEVNFLIKFLADWLFITGISLPTTYIIQFSYLNILESPEDVEDRIKRLEEKLID